MFSLLTSGKWCVCSHASQTHSGWCWTHWLTVLSIPHDLLFCSCSLSQRMVLWPLSCWNQNVTVNINSSSYPSSSSPALTHPEHFRSMTLCLQSRAPAMVRPSSRSWPRFPASSLTFPHPSLCVCLGTMRTIIIICNSGHITHTSMQNTAVTVT